MTLVLAISMLEVTLEASIPLVLLGGFVALCVHSVAHCEIETIPRFLRIARWFLGVSFPLALLVTGFAHVRSDSPADKSSFFLYELVGLPCFFALAYLIGAAQMNVLLHLVVRRYHRERRCVDDENASRAIRQMAARSWWLHAVLSIGSRMRFSEMLDRVCPKPTRAE